MRKGVSHKKKKGIWRPERIEETLPVIALERSRRFRPRPPRFTWILLLGSALVAHAQPFHLPTANDALFEPGGEEQFFVGTPGKPWISGAFGCVRSEGWQVHEGVDIRCLDRDKRNEPLDKILATADGKVAYINRKSSLSNYGVSLAFAAPGPGATVHPARSAERAPA